MVTANEVNLLDDPQEVQTEDFDLDAELLALDAMPIEYAPLAWKGIELSEFEAIAWKRVA